MFRCAVNFSNTFICMLLGLCVQPLSVIFPTCFHLLVPFLQCFEDCFPYHQLCFWFADCSSSNYNIFISSPVVLLVSSASFFSCQLPFISSPSLITSSLISSSIDFLLIAVYNFLLRPVLSEEIVHWSFPCQFFLHPPLVYFPLTC